MILWSGPLLPLAALIWPLLLGLTAALPRVRPHALRLLPLAPLPALVVAVTGTPDGTSAPTLLLGVQLMLDDSTRLLLGMAAALWTVAGIHAQSMAGGRHLALFAGFWCLTLAGNLGVFLAADVITFYAAFAAVSLSSWFLVVHNRDGAAFHAGKVYIVLALLGEVCLLLAFLIGAQAADSFLIADIRDAWALAPLGGVGIALLVTGFGIKAGMVPLHVWLPLAHPAAPVAASAVLSGAIVKAGLVGFLLFLPPGTLGGVLVALGLTGAFGAALWGLTQANPKTMLAYSTISQMGLMLALIGGGAGPVVVAFHAVHHGFAKGALFLAVGAVKAGAGVGRAITLFCAAAAALSVAGLPLTGGAAVKAVGKSGLGDWLVLALTLSGTTTALLLGAFLWRLARESTAGQGMIVQRVPMIALSLAALIAPWLIWPQALELAPAYALSRDAVFSAVWPLALALVLGLPLAPALAGRTFPRLALHPWPALQRPAWWQDLSFAMPFDMTAAALSLARVGAAVKGLERAMKRWRLSGLTAAALLLALALLMR